jgi:IrrE N-terminal-like domain
MTAFRRGFKTWCENAAKGFRRDLRLPLNSPLDPRLLAEHLKILVWTPQDVASRTNLDPRHLKQLLVHDSSSWSAVTLILPRHKLIIVNSEHAPVRQNSDIMHELAHLILEHPPARVDMTSHGLMILDTYNKTQEEEANWLAGALLVPRDGLLQVLSRNSRDDHAASHFCVSTKMLAMRRQLTGIDVQLRRRSPSTGA